ncbi:hypothetical protein G6F42_021646 [Rhizopus arrhizus]|nr:hypothetical protein G6F42_021646 [Rhizopus arrhizus]
MSATSFHRQRCPSWSDTSTVYEHPKEGISESIVINYYIDSTMEEEAPPVSIDRSTINISSPTLAYYARSIASRPYTNNVKLLQQKLVFLCLSDLLAPISFSSCSILEDGHFHFEMIAPKETRGKRQVIRPFTVRPHATDIMEWRPVVQCFKALLRDHPRLASSPCGSQLLFTKSNNINQPL